MYILIRTKDGVILEKIRDYLRRIGCWFREFNDPEYRISVSAEERVKNIQERQSGQLNPPGAWETCASFVEIWDWDSMDRGPWAKSPSEIEQNGDTAPKGKGFLTIGGRKIRVDGECANPTKLSYISCPKWCTKYEPTSIESLVYLTRQVAKEHERRATALHHQIEILERTDKTYREVIETGDAFNYRDGKFVIPAPTEQK